MNLLRIFAVVMLAGVAACAVEEVTTKATETGTTSTCPRTMYLDSNTGECVLLSAYVAKTAQAEQVKVGRTATTNFRNKEDEKVIQATAQAVATVEAEKTMIDVVCPAHAGFQFGGDDDPRRTVLATIPEVSRSSASIDESDPTMWCRYLGGLCHQTDSGGVVISRMGWRDLCPERADFEAVTIFERDGLHHIRYRHGETLRIDASLGRTEDWNRLHRYCNYKYWTEPSGYDKCMDGGWKSWYATAHWMR